MKLAIPDMVSNSYFPVVAAVEMGFFAEEGLKVEHELVFPIDASFEALRDGRADLVGGSTHAALAAFPRYEGAKLLCAQAQGMYWFLVVRADLGAARGDLSVLKGLKIGAAPWVDIGLRRLLDEAGIDMEAEGITIAPVPGPIPPGVSFGVFAAQRLEEGMIDAFWANGMAAEVAVRRGAGTVVLDVRRGDGPKAAFNFTQPGLVARADWVAREPEAAAAAVRAVNRTHAALAEDPERALAVGRKLFPDFEASLISTLVARDLPYYRTEVTPEFIDGMNGFLARCGLIDAPMAYDDIVADGVRDLWTR
jgi:ABC-type nitrate/sulfonate/bicarbonate transport system substrate-binding protein